MPPASARPSNLSLPVGRNATVAPGVFPVSTAATPKSWQAGSVLSYGPHGSPKVARHLPVNQFQPSNTSANNPYFDLCHSPRATNGVWHQPVSSNFGGYEVSAAPNGARGGGLKQPGSLLKEAVRRFSMPCPTADLAAATFGGYDSQCSGDAPGRYMEPDSPTRYYQAQLNSPTRNIRACPAPLVEGAGRQMMRSGAPPAWNPPCRSGGYTGAPFHHQYEDDSPQRLRPAIWQAETMRTKPELHTNSCMLFAPFSMDDSPSRYRVTAAPLMSTSDSNDVFQSNISQFPASPSRKTAPSLACNAPRQFPPGLGLTPTSAPIIGRNSNSFFIKAPSPHNVVAPASEARGQCSAWRGPLPIGQVQDAEPLSPGRHASEQSPLGSRTLHTTLRPVRAHSGGSAVNEEAVINRQALLQMRSAASLHQAEGASAIEMGFAWPQPGFIKTQRAEGLA